MKEIDTSVMDESIQTIHGQVSARAAKAVEELQAAMLNDKKADVAFRAVKRANAENIVNLTDEMSTLTEILTGEAPVAEASANAEATANADADASATATATAESNPTVNTTVVTAPPPAPQEAPPPPEVSAKPTNWGVLPWVFAVLGGLFTFFVIAYPFGEPMANWLLQEPSQDWDWLVRLSGAVLTVVFTGSGTWLAGLFGSWLDNKLSS